MRTHDFRPLPDLASRTLAGSVVYANDELFAERENLIKPEPAVFSTETFGHKGKIYDGWETRRRREAGFDYAIVRLGVPGDHPRRGGRHRLVQGQLPAAHLGRGDQHRGLPDRRRTAGGQLGDPGGEVGGQG